MPTTRFHPGTTVRRRTAIIEFVQATTTKDSHKFVPPEERIATFDEDGTTWVEHPMYTEVVFSMDRFAELAENASGMERRRTRLNPIITRDREAMAKLTLEDMMKIVVVTHTGVSPQEFDKAVSDWIAKGKRSALASPVQRADLPAHARSHAVFAAQTDTKRTS